MTLLTKSLIDPLTKAARTAGPDKPVFKSTRLLEGVRPTKLCYR